MADILTSSDLEKMNKSLSDMTDLSRALQNEFKKIKDTSGLLNYDFTSLSKTSSTLKTLSEKYLFSQRANVSLSEKINQLKSKSGYLDNISLDFKKEEMQLQMRIAAAQIKALQSKIAISNIDKIARENAINELKIQNLLRGTELKYYDQTSKKNNTVIEQFQKQLEISEKTLDNIQLVSDEFAVQPKLLGFGKKILSDMGPLGTTISSAFNASNINPWVLAAQTTVAILEKGYENFKLFDKAAVSVRHHLGVLPGQANKLELLIKEVGLDSMHLGATFDEVGKSIISITDEFTSLVAQDKDLLKTTTALSKQFGIAESTTAKFLKTMGGISDNSVSSQISITGFAQKIAQAAGVPLGKIMEDIANASDSVREYISNSAISMIKAAAAARMMGIDLNKAASSAEKLLQFESSISSELKASAMLGQNVNFNYVRQLSFAKNLIGANKEILRITKEIGFNQLNPLQQKAFAEAAGKSVSELQDMLQQEKNIQLVKNGTNEKAKKALADYERLMQLKDEEAKNEGKLAEQDILRRANQEKLAQIQNKFNQLVSELAEPVLEILDGFLTIATYALPYIKLSIVPIITLTRLYANLLVPIGNNLIKWGRAISIFGSKFMMIGKILGTVSKFAGGFLRLFGTKVPVIGWIISGFLVIKNLFRDTKRLFEDGGSWGEKIIKGLFLVPKAIIEAFLPFDAVKKKLDEWFFGKSPSKAGRLIAKGFSSIGPELQDSLTTPIRSAYKEIENMSTPEVSVETKSSTGLNTSVDNTLIGTIQTGNQQLIAKIDQLINMMASGGIAINLDGQLVSRQLSTTSYRFGGFGQSTSLA